MHYFLQSISPRREQHMSKGRRELHLHCGDIPQV